MDCLFSDITEVGSKKDQDHPPVAGLESKQQVLCLQPSLTSICIQLSYDTISHRRASIQIAKTF